MWSEALSMLDRAERLQRQFFHHAAAAWEPPVDITESAGELQVQVALPGVPADSIAMLIDSGGTPGSAMCTWISSAVSTTSAGGSQLCADSAPATRKN